MSDQKGAKIETSGIQNIQESNGYVELCIAVHYMQAIRILAPKSIVHYSWYIIVTSNFNKIEYYAYYIQT